MVGSLVSLLLATLAQAASFRGLGDLPGGSFESRANGVSADGKVVVGASASVKGTEAFRWTTETGMVGLGDLSGGDFYSTANGVSANGAVIVGASSSNQGTEAFRWSQESGMAGLGYLPGGQFYSEANAVSADGTVVVGTGHTPPIGGMCAPDCGVPFRWTQSDGMVSLAFPIFFDDAGRGVSADGTVVVGTSEEWAFRWTATTGRQLLKVGGTASPYRSDAYGISADGTVVVGSWDNHNGAFRWTEEQDMVNLGMLPGAPDPTDTRRFVTSAYAASANGAVIVGTSDSGEGQQAFLWDEQHGMQSLLDLLVAQGINLTGWSLTEATAISADGRTVVGYGRNPAGQTEGWIATLESFSDFSAFHVMRLVIDQSRGSLFLGSNFTLGRDNNGINPVKEEVMLKIANATLTIPAGSFHENSPPSLFAFAGQIDNVWIEALIKPVGKNRFAFQALAYGVPLGDTKNPVTVELTIGDDRGTTTAKAHPTETAGSP